MSHTEKEVSRIVAAGALGRSPVYARLLRYLCDRSESGTLPREIDIAADVFGRDDFDPANDSTVRVYLHNLRQKLDAFYAEREGGEGPRLVIPKGEYRLAFRDPPAAPRVGVESRSTPGSTAIVIALAVAVAAFFLGRLTTSEAPTIAETLAETAIWQPLLNDDRPITVVVGDYYIFAEQDEYGPGNRLIRDFGINDKDEFDAFIDANPDLAGQYRDVRLSYLPTGIGAALNDILAVLHTRQKLIRVIPQSQFAAPMLRGSHIVYVGYLSAMDSLAQYAFGSSRLALGLSYDELIDTETGDSYVSLAGYIEDDDSGYKDFGFVSSFPGPSGNQFLYVAGMRDEGLMRMASILADPQEVDAIAAAVASDTAEAPAFEALYEVSSLDRTHVAAKRLFVSPIDATVIWQN